MRKYSVQVYPKQLCASYPWYCVIRARDVAEAGHTAKHMWAAQHCTSVDNVSFVVVEH